MMFAFAYIWLGLAGWVQVTGGENPYRVTYTASAEIRAAAIVLLGLASYDVGRVLGRTSTRAKPDRTDVKRRIVTKRRAWFTIWITVLLVPVLVQIQGGIGTYLVSRAERGAKLQQLGLYTDASSALGGLVTSLAAALPLISLLALLRLMQREGELRKRPNYLLTVAGMAVATAILSNPVATPRFWVGTAALSVLISNAWASSLRGFRTVTCSLLVVLVFVFPYADYFRNVRSNLQVYTPSHLFANKLDYDASAQMINAVNYRAATGGTHGHQLLGPLLFWVPRSVWPDKPEATGTLLGEFIHFQFLNLSSPLWLEGYLDWGLGGVVAIFIVYGWFAMKGDARLSRLGRSSPIDFAVFALPVVAVQSLVLLRGSLLSQSAMFATVVACLFLASERPRAGVSKAPLHAALRVTSPSARTFDSS
jgi:hypothetical protein